MNCYKSNVSVAIWMVTYNQEKYIQKSIESIMSQRTNFPIKLLIGEDSSTDRTKEICEEISEKYKNKIELFSHNKNKGPNENAIYIYNKCLQSGAKYIALCEGDDYWTDPLKLQKQVDFLEANCDYFFVSSNSETKMNNNSVITSVEGELGLEDFITGNKLGRQTAAFLFRNTELNEFLEYLKQYDWPFADLALIMWCLKHGRGMVLEDSMVFYRKHDLGLWSSANEEERAKNFISFYSMVLKSGINPAYTVDHFIKSVEWTLNSAFNNNKKVNSPNYIQLLVSKFNRVLGKIK